MNTTTRANLEQALRGEAFAALKYWLFEEQAEAEDREEVAELFEAIGKQERREHAREIATMLGMPGSTRENLLSSIEGEVDEHRRLYPGFASMARQRATSRPPSIPGARRRRAPPRECVTRSARAARSRGDPAAMIGAAGGTESDI